MTKESNIKISIIVPIFNAAEYLELLITSLLNQSASSLEVIAVNDGSTDESIQILKKIANKDSRLIILSQINLGVSAARNYALQFARGKWIAFADGDDWLNPDTLETWCQYAEKNNIDIVLGNGFKFTKSPNEKNPTPILKNQPWGEIINGKEWIKRSVDKNEWPHYVWLQLINRDLIFSNKIHFSNEIIHEDILWTLKIAMVAKRMGFIKVPLYGYRTNPESIMGSSSITTITHRAQSYIFIMQYFVALANKQVTDTALRRALFRHSNHEGGHFIGLLRKRLDDPVIQCDLAKKFIALGLSRAMFKGAKNSQELWRAIRCWFTLRFLANSRK